MENINFTYKSEISNPELTKQLELKNIRFGMHWGKINHILNKKRVRWMYGDEKVNTWLKHRSQLLSPEVREVFNNDFLKQCGLDSDDILV